MSDAIVCTDQHLERHVIIKRLKSGTDQRRLMDEIAALQAIRSKHVVQIYDVINDKSGNVVAVVEEYLSGPDLTSTLAPADAETFMKLIYPMAEGIADIHAHGRVHRDIKRQNMKYDAEGCLKIFDFGLARDLSTASTMGIVGTPGYMAPELFEQSKGGRSSFTPAVDTFAFAATALAVVLGKLPRALRETPPELPSTTVDFTRLSFSLPSEISKLLNLCIHQRASERPPIKTVAETIGLHLLRDRHRALLSVGGKSYMLDKANRVVRLSTKDQGSLTITYDGLRFVIGEVEGDVAVNNLRASNGASLPGSCVIVLGAPELQGRRTSITVDVSHPEVVL